MACAEDGIAGDEQLRSCLDDLSHRVVSHAAVHFDFKCQAQLLADFRETPDFIQRKGDEFLSAEAGIHAHDEDVVDHGQDIDDEVDPGGGIENDAGLHAMLRDVLERAMEMAAGLVMDADPVGSCFGQGGDEFVWVLDHQVAVERQGGGLAEALDDRGAEGNVGDEMAIHDVDMDDGAATELSRGNLVGQVGEVGGEDGGEKLDHRCVSLLSPSVSAGMDGSQRLDGLA